MIETVAAIKPAELDKLKADLIVEKIQVQKHVKSAEELSPSDSIEISCRGEVVVTSLALLKKIPGSVLEQMLSGKLVHGYDKEGRPFFNIDKAIFHHIIDYLRNDRTCLPPAEDHTVRKLVETEIIILGLEKGLAAPDSLMTCLAM